MTHLDIEKERPKFEAWAREADLKTRRSDESRNGTYHGEYYDDETCAAWMGYLAGRRASLPPVAAPVSQQDADCADAFDFPKAALKREDWDVATRRPKVPAEQPRACARHVPDSECAQSRCANAITGCSGECELKRKTAKIIGLANASGIDVDTDGDIWGSTNGALFVFARAIEAELASGFREGRNTQPETAGRASLQADEGKEVDSRFVLVPKEPTQAMCDAARAEARSWENSGDPWSAMTWFRIYRAMLRAAITAKEGQKP
jgi:hypothetical protein